MNWNDPQERLALIEKAGAIEYNRRLNQHCEDSTLAVVNGYPIRAINSPRFGRVYMVDGLGKGHSTLAGAKAMAERAPKNGN